MTATKERLLTSGDIAVELGVAVVIVRRILDIQRDEIVPQYRAGLTRLYGPEALAAVRTILDARRAGAAR